MMPFGRDFGLFLGGTSLSAIGTAMIPVALSFALLDAGHAAGALGLVLAAQALPTAALLLFGGVLGDRWPRRSIMIRADLLCCAAQGALALLLVRGSTSLAPVVALAALVGVGTAFLQPARGAFVAEIVAPDQLARANGAVGAGAAIAMIVGPALAALIVGAVGAGWAVAIDGASYGASALCLALVSVRGAAAAADGSRGTVMQDMRAGLAAFAGRRWLWLLVGQFGLLNLVAFTPVLVIAPVLFSGSPHGAAHWGWLLSACGVGGLLGAAAIMRWPPRRAGLAIEAAVLLLAAPLLLLAVRAPLPLLLLSGLGYGAGEAVVNVMIGTMIQREIPAHLLSRVFSVVQIAAGVLAPAGYALAGPVSAWLGPDRALLGAGLASLASVGALLCVAEIRGFGLAPADPSDAPRPA
ncbi:MFS transporter [Rhizosaccharibacter radicis]|uniref:MFS transporter n=1 Tax=Rhizosaccharibacter radicis TaxID=2782605 RepID=A0ABT1W2P4_9PROT|nr:MFS transporter [Acetobacteraceae bacterium KSS12]